MVPDTSDIASPAKITADAARRLTDNIKIGLEATWSLIIEAYESRAWAVLGHASWDDYCTREFGASRIRLPREDRSEIVGSLRDAGLSIRAIAAATGFGVGSVHRELAPVPNGTPEAGVDHAVVGDNPVGVTDSEMAYFNRLADIPEATFDRIIEECKAEGHLSRDAVLHRVEEKEKEAKTTIGTDGKRYPKPVPTPPAKRKRAPLPDAVRSGGWELRKDVERLQRLRADDRWSGHVDQVADVLRSHLEFTVQVCQELLEEFEEFEAGGRR